MQVNHLSTALVSLLLLPIMTKTAKTYGTASRLAIVSSEMHYMAKITSTLMAAPAIFETLASKEYSTKRHITLVLITTSTDFALASWRTATKTRSCSTFSSAVA
jgi:hypothetical protein